MHSNGDNFNDFNANQSQNGLNNPRPGMPSRSGGSGFAPPLPPRPNAMPNSNNYRYGNYGHNLGFGQPMSGYSPYSCNPFNGLGSYGSAYGLNRFNSNNNYFGNDFNQNDFIRMAEDSSRQAFQSIESIVQAFGSVSMMLESTYFAVHSSFRAVIGVADHFSRLRNHLAQILTTLAIVRTFKAIIRRILHLIGIRRSSAGTQEDTAWNQAFSDSNRIESHLRADGTFDLLNSEDKSQVLSTSRSSWPIFLFFGVIFGAPWLIWRLLSSMTGSDKSVSNNWMTGEDEHYEAIALYDFRSDIPRELPFSVGQKIIVAPKELQPRVKGWLLATVNGKKVGLIPANYVRISGCHNPKVQKQ